MLLVSHRVNSPPPSLAIPDLSGKILSAATTSAGLIPGQGLRREIISRRLLTLGSSVPPIAVGPGGVGANIAGSDANAYIELASLADNILSTTACTLLIVRSLNSLSYGPDAGHGYNDGPASRVQVHLPYQDGNVYWDFGNSSGGRLSVSGVSWAIDKVQAWALVAGPNKGREIWLDGVKLAGDTGQTATRTTGSGLGFRVGAAHSTGGGGGANAETIYQFVVLNEELSDAKIKAWSYNVWRILRSAPRRMWMPSTVTIADVPFAARAPYIKGIKSTTGLSGMKY